MVNIWGIYCIFLIMALLTVKDVLSQSVTITEDIVYIRNNAVGHVTCTLNGNCGGINWYLSSMAVPMASAFPGFSCTNSTTGYYQTCDYQNNQYKLYFTGSTNLHGQRITCSGEACSPQKTTSDTATIFTIVPISSVSLEGIAGQQINVTAEQSKSIICVTGTSRPASHILWYIGGTNVTSLSTESINTATSQMYYTRSTLTFTPTKSQNGLQLNCKAYNTDSHIAELTTKPTLNVQYEPGQVTLNPSSTSHVINETYQLGPIKCSADCKPPCTYKWIRPNQNDMQGDTLLVNSILRTQTGTYKCWATNVVGTQTSSDVIVTVHFAAKITSMSISGGNNFTISEHSIETITCLAEGLPKPRITLRYTSSNSVLKSVDGDRLDFRFSSARCNDTGTYQCHAVNTFTPKKALQKDVLVLCKPRAKQKPLPNEYDLRVGETLNITISYLAYPRPTFHWFKNISNGSSTEIIDGHLSAEINNTIVNTYTFVTKLTRKNLMESDFGTYILKTKNVIGSSEDVYVVRAKGKPELPFSGLATCIGYNSAVITWWSGFDNGDVQTFSVIYKEVDGTRQTLVSGMRDPGQNKPLSHLLFPLRDSTTYVFNIYSSNSFGDSSRLEVHCSTSVKNDEESVNSYNNGINIGIIIGLIVGITSTSFVFVIFLVRKGQLNKTKCSSGNETNDIVKEQRYDDIKTDKEETHVYEGINQEGADTIHNIQKFESIQTEYEHLRDGPESSTYKKLDFKGAGDIQMASIYVNTRVK